MKHNQKGFTTVEIILVVLVLALLGGVGWYVWHNRSNNRATMNTTTGHATDSESTAAQPDSEITSGPGEEWNTYTNNKVGFSIQIPKMYKSGQGAECTKVSYVNDNYGNKVSSEARYITTAGAVPATVVDNNNNFYIVEQYTYQLSEIKDDGSGHKLAGGCQKTTTTKDTIVAYEKHNSSTLLDVLPFSVIKVAGQTDILTWAKSHFKDDTIKITDLKDNAGGWQDVELDCSSDNPCTDFNFKFDLRYYKEKNKLVFLAYGQAGHLQKTNSDEFYDGQVFASFKLL